MLAFINKYLRAYPVTLLLLSGHGQGFAEEVVASTAGGESGADVTAAGTASAAVADASTLLASADAIRFPRESFQTDITVTNYRDDEVDEARIYRVLSRGNENTIVLTVEPAAERGQALLMRGRDLWIYMPSVSQPIRLSLSQRLTGQVANGDLARANFAGDYNAELLRQDSFNDRPVVVLALTAAGKGVTYDKVNYWIDAENNRPLYAEFFARSGRLLKTMRYEAFKELAGALRPTRLVIDDALKPGRRSVLTYERMGLKELPEHVFTRDYLRRLQ